MNRILITIFLLTCTAIAVAADLDTILAENAKAHGGTHLAKVQAVQHNLHIKEPAFKVKGHYTATREGHMRIDIYSGPQRVFAEGLPGDCGWAWRPGESEPDIEPCVPEAETAALRHGIEMPGHFYTLEDVRDRGATVELIGEVEGEKGPEWQVQLTLPDGFSRDYFISQETHRLTRARDHRAFHPGVNATEVTVETRYAEPTFIDDVLRYMRQDNVNVETGEVLGTTRVLSLKHNPEIVEGMFAAEWVPDQADHAMK